MVRMIVMMAVMKLNVVSTTSNTCIDSRRVCDGQNDCDDDSDEAECGKYNQ